MRRERRLDLASGLGEQRRVRLLVEDAARRDDRLAHRPPRAVDDDRHRRDPELPEERAAEVVARTRELVERGGGTWGNQEVWGRRKLAYEIDHKGEGVYHLLLFSAAPATLAEVSRVLKITDGVIRHLAVKRVKGGQTKAPATVGAVSAAADDASGTAE